MAQGMPKTLKECLEVCRDRERNGDLRTRIGLYGAAGLKPGMVFLGWVRSSSEKGVFVTLTQEVDVRVPFSELSDGIVRDSHR